MTKTFIAITAAASLLFSLPLDLAADDNGQKKYGVIHNIAEDRMVERVGGIYEPEGIDKYMKRRFDDMKDQINRMDSRLENMESQLAQALGKLDEIASKEEGETKISSREPEPPRNSSAIIRSSGSSILIGSSGRTEITEN